MPKQTVEMLVQQCRDLTAPVILEAELSEEETTALLAQLTLQQIAARAVHGETLSGKADLLNALADAFAFPGYFGHNWDAALECLSNMRWLPADGYVCILTAAQTFRASQPAVYADLCRIAGYAAERWQEPPDARPFKLVCLC